MRPKVQNVYNLFGETPEETILRLTRERLLEGVRPFVCDVMHCESQAAFLQTGRVQIARGRYAVSYTFSCNRSEHIQARYLKMNRDGQFMGKYALSELAKHD